MTKTDEYRTKLRSLDDWETYLLEESGLPGPRGNIELAQAVAEEGDRTLFECYTAYTPELAPVNSPYEFLAFCGALGMGRLLAEGETDLLEALRRFASDPRWRMREAVAMALQRLGDKDMDILIAAMQEWSTGNPLEQRAAAAGLCEPRLLGQARHARAVLMILDQITSAFPNSPAASREYLLVLRKGLGYCWSVAVASLPEEGKLLMEKWLNSSRKDIRSIMQENLKKNRLLRMDLEWVRKWQARN